MKKTLLIIAIVLCIAVAGTAIALQFSDPDPITGTLTADSYLELSLGRCSTTAIELNESEPAYYTVYCDIGGSENRGTNDCTLTVRLTNTSETVTLGAVTAYVYSDSSYSTLVSNGSVKGAGSITVYGITASTPYYVKLVLDSNLTAEETAVVGGQMELSFVKAAA